MPSTWTVIRVIHQMTPRLRSQEPQKDRAQHQQPTSHDNGQKPAVARRVDEHGPRHRDPKKWMPNSEKFEEIQFLSLEHGLEGFLGHFYVAKGAEALLSLLLLLE